VILIGEYPDGDSSDSALAPGYPYRLDALPGVTTPKWSSRVVAFSKLPILTPKIVPATGGFSRPFLTFSVTIADSGALNVYAAHPNAPMKPNLRRDRDAMIDALARTVAAPFVMAGDFNATPWCSVFSRIPGARVGNALRPTWLTKIPLLGLTIDHIMVSAGVKPSIYTCGAFLGSDHRPLLARVHLPVELK
jgi:endonuclease/exonuclease/phosphatase (EEP) superfamily protein YafD